MLASATSQQQHATGAAAASSASGPPSADIRCGNCWSGGLLSTNVVPHAMASFLKYRAGKETVKYDNIRSHVMICIIACIVMKYAM